MSAGGSAIGNGGYVGQLPWLRTDTLRSNDDGPDPDDDDEAEKARMTSADRSMSLNMISSFCVKPGPHSAGVGEGGSAAAE